MKMVFLTCLNFYHVRRSCVKFCILVSETDRYIAAGSRILVCAVQLNSLMAQVTIYSDLHLLTSFWRETIPSYL